MFETAKTVNRETKNLENHLHVKKTIKYLGKKSQKDKRSIRRETYRNYEFIFQERKVVQILQRHEAIKEKDLNPWDLVIKEIIDDFQLNNFFIVDQGI